MVYLDRVAGESEKRERKKMVGMGSLYMIGYVKTPSLLFKDEG